MDAIMDAPPTTPGLTHASLRATFKIVDAGFANTAFDSLSLLNALYNLRMREVYHMGFAFCDAHICSAEAIEKLVNERVAQINAEPGDPFVPNVLEAEEEVKHPDARLMEWMAEAGVGRLANLAGAVEEEQGAYRTELDRISTRTSYGPSAIDAAAVRESVAQVPSTPPGQEIEYPDTESGNTLVVPSTPWEEQEMPDTQPGQSFYPDTVVEDPFYPDTQAAVSFYPDTEPSKSFSPRRQSFQPPDFGLATLDLGLIVVPS
jgi:hypothetical protein